jgi:hypothetical protein
LKYSRIYLVYIIRRFFMILHLGGDIIISMKDIVAIISCEDSESPQAAAAGAKSRKVATEVIPGGGSKSCVITARGGIEKHYYSPISSATLLRRSQRRDLAGL